MSGIMLQLICCCCACFWTIFTFDVHFKCRARAAFSSAFFTSIIFKVTECCFTVVYTCCFWLRIEMSRAVIVRPKTGTKKGWKHRRTVNIKHSSFLLELFFHGACVPAPPQLIYNNSEITSEKREYSKKFSVCKSTFLFIQSCFFGTCTNEAWNFKRLPYFFDFPYLVTSYLKLWVMPVRSWLNGSWLWHHLHAHIHQGIFLLCTLMCPVCTAYMLHQRTWNGCSCWAIACFCWWCSPSRIASIRPAFCTRDELVCNLPCEMLLDFLPWMAFAGPPCSFLPIPS